MMRSVLFVFSFCVFVLKKNHKGHQDLCGGHKGKSPLTTISAH